MPDLPLIMPITYDSEDLLSGGMLYLQMTQYLVLTGSLCTVPITNQCLRALFL